MLLTITNTRPPATDLGWLLHKHPDKVQTFRTTAGRATVLYPRADEDQCTAALLLMIDPIDLVRAAGPGGHAISTNYVNDRPYVAASLLSSALSNVYSSALNGRCVDRPDLVETPLSLTVTLSVVRVESWPNGLADVFEPLGYAIDAIRHPLDERFPDWGESLYYTLTLRHTITVRELLEHLYVLLPVLDNARHNFVQEQDVDTLVKKGGSWLARHPQRTLITRRFLRRQSDLTRLALDRLLTIEDAPADALSAEPLFPNELTTPESGTLSVAESVPARRVTLHEQRLDAVLAGLLASGATSVLDLGCGEGQLLRKLLTQPQFSRIVGMDVAYRELLRAKIKLHYDELPTNQRDRLTLLQGSLLYRDQRLEGFDAAALVEVIEHVEPARLPDLTRVLFGFISPQTVFITTPNAEYNELYGLDESQTRHLDHRFEWSRAEFGDWCEVTAHQYGYEMTISGVGEADELVGASSQLARFQKTNTK